MSSQKHKGSHVIIETILNPVNKIKNAIFTIKSLKKDKDYTYKIRTSSFGNRRYIHVYYEYGYLDFKYLGFYWDGKIRRKGNIIVDTPVAQAISWSMSMIERGKIDKFTEFVEILHTGKCAKCGRTLTDARSIELGVGPQCRSTNHK